MDTRILAAALLAIGLMLASILHGGIYLVTAGSGDAFAWRVNKFTGEMAACRGWVCEKGSKIK